LQGSWLVMRSISCRQSAAVTRGPPRSAMCGSVFCQKQC
jgi:hypothetical protein